MGRRIFDTIWIALAIIAGFSAIIKAVVLAVDHLPFVLIAVILVTPFGLGWEIAKDRAATRRAKTIR